MKLNFKSVKAAVLKADYLFFEHGNYNLNLIGIRTKDQQSDSFNDWMCVLFYIDDEPVFFKFSITTDPGLYYRLNPINNKGVAIVKAGQYLGVWCTGFHKGQYAGLVQKKPITVYRDNNKDDHIDIGVPTDKGFHGINCHRSIANGISEKIGRWSAGCQVFSNANDFRIFMALCDKSAANWGDSFTYTLLEEEAFEKEAFEAESL